MTKKTIYKYKLEVTDVQTIEMPFWADILSIQVQRGTPTMWVLVDKEESRTQKRTFFTFGTGHEIQEKADQPLFYQGTYQLANGNLVFHVFEAVTVGTKKND